MRKIWKILNNNFVGLFIGIVISSIFYISQKSKTEISYSISPTDIITQSGISSKINVYYDTILCKDVKLVKISFWNSGSTLIDDNVLLKAYPLTISPTYKSENSNQNDTSSKIQILEVSIVKKTRDKLGLNSYCISNKLNNSDRIGIDFLNNDGLEPREGVTLHVLFSTDKDVSWSFTGRIKGNSAPFKIEKWQNVNSNFIGKLILQFFFLAFTLLMIFRYEPIVDHKPFKIGDYIAISVISIGSLCVLIWFIVTFIDYIDFKNLIELFH